MRKTKNKDNQKSSHIFYNNHCICVSDEEEIVYMTNFSTKFVYVISREPFLSVLIFFGEMNAEEDNKVKNFLDEVEDHITVY